MKKTLVTVVVVIVALAGGALAAARLLSSSAGGGGTISGTIRAVVVRSDSGDLELSTGKGAAYHVDARYLFDRPKFEKSLVDGVLTIESSCKGSALRCDVDLEVTVPVGVKLTVESGSGKVSIHTR